MSTKLQAAQKAGASGIPMVIASGREPGTLPRLLKGEPVGTYFSRATTASRPASAGSRSLVPHPGPAHG